MIISHLNYLAVAVSAIIYFAIGGLWYSPVLFVRPWMAGHGITMPTDEETKKKMRAKMPLYMGTTLITCFIGTMCIGYLEVAACTFTWMGGAKIGIVCSIFAAIAIGLSHLHTKKSLRTFIIDWGYHLVGLVVVGVIMALWR